MKKVLLFIFSFIFLINTSFAFNISDSNNINMNYFSISNHQVFIKTDLNLSNFSINYILNSINKSKIINLNKCSNSFCANFSLLNILNTSPTNTKFEINLSNQIKNIFLDTSNPIFNFINYSIDKNNKSLKLNFMATDNNNFTKIKIYKKQGVTSTFLTQLNNTNFYIYNINKSENLSFEFKVYDLSNNFISYLKSIFVEDIFKPKINSYFLTKDENSKYFFKFEIADENLYKYEISQNLISLSEILNGTKFNKNLEIPFNTGNILFKVIDKNLNEISNSINLNSTFQNTYNNIFSNNNIFSFSSNANLCKLISVDSIILNSDFQKQSEEFSYNLNINENKNYSIKFSCSDSNFKQIYVKTFVYDMLKPTISNLSAKNLEDGSIKLSWTKSVDSQSKIRYKLLRNGNVIYSGNRLDFLDSKVVFPNSYSYQLKIYDEASNYVSSKKINLIPKKTIVIFTTKNIKNDLKVNDSFFSFSLNTDKNSSITIIHKFNNKEILNKKINNNNSNEINLSLNLLKGKNEVSIKVVDEFSNAKIKTYTINYEPKILSSPKNIIKKTEIIPKKIISENSLNSNLTKKNLENKIKKNEKFSFWFWPVFIILLFIIFLWIFIFNENKLKNRLNDFKNKKVTDSFHKKRKFDVKLNKSLEKIRFERAKKLEEIKLKEKRKKEKSKRVLSDLEKKKFEDLKNRRAPQKDILFSINQRQKIKKRAEKIKNKKSYNHFLKEKTQENFSDFFKRKINEFTNFKKENTQEFNSYLNKKRSEKSWSNPRDYLMSTKLEKDKLEEERRKSIEGKRAEKLKAESEKEKEILKNLEAKEKHRQEKEKLNIEKEIAKQSFDEYLSKKTKNRKGFFAELDLARDLFKRNKKR